MTKHSSRSSKSKASTTKDTARDIVDNIPSKPEHVALVDTLYTSLHKTVEGLLQKDGISAANIFIIIDTTMRLAGKLNTLDGIEKKAIVIIVIKKLIEESDLKPEDEAAIEAIVDIALSSVIDHLFSLAPELYGKIKAGCLSCFKK